MLPCPKILFYCIFPYNTLASTSICCSSQGGKMPELVASHSSALDNKLFLGLLWSRQGPRLSIRIVIWILPSDTVSLFGVHKYFSSFLSYFQRVRRQAVYSGDETLRKAPSLKMDFSTICTVVLKIDSTFFQQHDT